MSTLIQSGNLLIAHPRLLGDDTFQRAVILMCSTSKNSPLGFIINHPMEYKLSELVPEISCDLPIFQGGPVDGDHLFLIHYGKQVLPKATAISKNVYFGGEMDSAFEAIHNGKLHINNCRFFLGYSGWSSQQLEDEINQGAWIVQSCSRHTNLFEQSSTQLWASALRKEGGEYSVWANTPQNPSYN